MSEQTNGGGVPAPNHTQTPNILLDDWLPLMGDAELRVVLVITRQTFGYHKDEDRLSLSQLEEKSGLSRQGVLNGIEAALDHGIIYRIEAGQSYKYGLIVQEISIEAELVNEVDQSTRLTSNWSTPLTELVNEVDTQKKLTKETNQKKDGGDSSTIFALYEDEKFGKLTALAGEEIQADIDEYGAEAVIEAIKIAVRSNVRKWSYVQGILRKQAADAAQPDVPDEGGYRFIRDGVEY